MSTQRPRCALQCRTILVFQSPTKESSTFWACHCPSASICPYLPQQHMCPESLFFLGRKYGYIDMVGCSHVPSVPSHLRNGRSELQGAPEQQCVSVYPSRDIPGICTISETFLFPVCGGVRIHSASSLDL